MRKVLFHHLTYLPAFIIIIGVLLIVLLFLCLHFISFSTSSVVLTLISIVLLPFLISRLLVSFSSFYIRR